MEGLTTTGFALLAQIALRPASAYELTRLMHRNLHYLWPRAESRLYAEVTRLERAGLVVGRDERAGRRLRRVMTATTVGREALRNWVSRDVAPGVSIGSEALLRVFFASWGTVDDLRRAIAQVQEDARKLLETAEAVGADYLGGAGTAPEQLHTRAMIHELLSGYALLLTRWSGDQMKEISSWKDLSPHGKRQRARRRFSISMKRLVTKRVADK
ncbi:MAG: PadR family transcriptional regulator [Rhodospirillales bacterium]|nr:PadR family transcriptional regulator [Rhodospirillales bacterium]